MDKNAENLKFQTDFACDHVPLECDITELVDKTVLLAASGQIDQTENMADDRFKSKF